MGQRLFDNGKPDTDGPSHVGLRQMLRERFLLAGGEDIPDTELLKLFLMLVEPRCDVKPLAKSLLDQFGDFASVISANPEKLQCVPGMGDTTVTALKLAKVVGGRLLQIQA